jgi:voltage-gated potassium channel
MVKATVWDARRDRAQLMAGSQEGLDRFEQQTALPMMILALAIIPLLVVPLIIDLPSGVETTFFALDWFIWVAFVLEYGIRLYLAPGKRYFVSHNIIDLLFVLIPFLRPLRIVRSVRAFSLLRAFRGTVILLRAVKAAKALVTTHKLGYTLLIAVAVVVGSGLLVATLEESSPERNIQSIPDGLWWAVTTMTTVGYGDRFPVTAAGRAIGASVMILGIGLFGLLAATLASFLVEKDLEKKEIDPQIAEMAERLERMEQLLEKLQLSDEGSDGSQIADAHQSRRDLGDLRHLDHLQRMGDHGR